MFKWIAILLGIMPAIELAANISFPMVLTAGHDFYPATKLDWVEIRPGYLRNFALKA